MGIELKYNLWKLKFFLPIIVHFKMIFINFFRPILNYNLYLFKYINLTKYNINFVKNNFIHIV